MAKKWGGESEIGGMGVFDADEHIDYTGSSEGDSTGLSRGNLRKNKNSGGQRYKGHANGPKKAPKRQRARGDDYEMYRDRSKKRMGMDKMGVADRAPDEDGFWADDAQFKQRQGAGKGVND